MKNKTIKKSIPINPNYNKIINSELEPGNYLLRFDNLHRLIPFIYVGKTQDYVCIIFEDDNKTYWKIDYFNTWDILNNNFVDKEM